ncbi:MAG: NAD-dependent epimerase/dehydratase family protein [bacterium]
MASFYLESDIEETARNLGKTARAFSGKTILVSGGHGFLGRYFTALFMHLNEGILEAPCQLIVLDNLITAGETGAVVPETTPYTFIRHDVIEPFSWEGPVDFLIHAAGIASPFYYRKYPIETLEAAVHGARNMLDLAREKNAKFLFFSSSEIYGDPDPRYVPTPESYRGNVSPLGPRACYDESKRLGETFTRIYHEHFGVSGCIVRPFNVYGPGMGERDYRVLPNFANRIIGGHPVNVYGTGRQTRTFCYITDAITGFLKVLVEGTPGEAYNIGNPQPEISMLDLVAHIEGVLGRKVEVNRIDYPDSYPPDEPNRRCPDITKARRHLNFEPSIALDEGLRRFFAWAEGAYSGE